MNYLYLFLFKNADKKFLYLVFITLTAGLIPNIFLTDNEHFLYGIPFITLSLYAVIKSILVSQKHKRKLILFLSIIFVFILLPRFPKILNFRFFEYMGLFYFVFLIFGFCFVTKKYLKANCS